MSLIKRFTDIENKLNELEAGVLEAEAKIMELQAKEMSLIAREKNIMSKSLTPQDIEELGTIKLEQRATAGLLREAEASKVEAEYLAGTMIKNLLSTFGSYVVNEDGTRTGTEYGTELRAEYTKKVNPKIAKLCRLLAEVGEAYKDIEALQSEYSTHTKNINNHLYSNCNGVGVYGSDTFNIAGEVKARYIEVVPVEVRNFLNNLNKPVMYR